MLSVVVSSGEEVGVAMASGSGVCGSIAGVALTYLWVGSPWDRMPVSLPCRPAGLPRLPRLQRSQRAEMSALRASFPHRVQVTILLAACSLDLPQGVSDLGSVHAAAGT